ncbi:hypothetical protein [Streptomyces sp. NPDC096934]|uniref:hypothetical protein n=1 Tax=Streptomyces sp. NPDC096934 TaxID=3155551 RepID=UPI00331834D7
MTMTKSRPITGDHVDLILDASWFTVTGSITVGGVTAEGVDCAKLILPDTDPQHRRALKATTSVQYWLYRDSILMYHSPLLQVTRVHRTDSGNLTVTAARHR